MPTEELPSDVDEYLDESVSAYINDEVPDMELPDYDPEDFQFEGPASPVVDETPDGEDV